MNYESVNEIFAAGIKNMTCLFKDSGSYDEGSYAIAGADYTRYMGTAVSTIYAHGNSYWGFNTDAYHLKVDNRDCRMRSLYREEGTLFGYYKFFKIRWEGWSHYNSSGGDYQLKYDLILWDTGDISLHMANIPVQCYDGGFEFVADKSYSFTKPTIDAPDVTFQYDTEGKTYTVKYAAIDLVVPFKLLISDSNGILYTVEEQAVNDETEEVLVALEETEVTALLFKTRGFSRLPEWKLIKDLDTPSVMSWSDSRAFPLTAVITGTPPKQYIECVADLSDGTVLGIKSLNAEYTGTVTEQHSFDGQTFTDEVDIADFLTTDPGTLYAGLTESRRITFRFWLAGDATLTTFVMNYRNEEDNNASRNYKN